MEINGKRVSAFDEFLERFVTAQEEARLKKHRNLHNLHVFLFRVSCVVFLVWF